MSGDNGIYTEQFRADLQNAVRVARSDLGRTFRDRGLEANRAKAYYEIASALLREAQRMDDRGITSVFQGQVYARLVDAAELLQSQAEITTGSGDEGAGAILGNLNAMIRAAGTGRYEVGLEEFSWEIVDATLQFFEAIALRGDSSAFDQIRVNNQKAVDGTVWQARGLINYFPGTALTIDYGAFDLGSLVWETSYSQRNPLVRSSLEGRHFGPTDYLRFGGGAQVLSAFSQSVFRTLGNDPSYLGFEGVDLPTAAGSSLLSPGGRNRYVVDEFGRSRIENVATGQWLWTDDNNDYIGFVNRFGAGIVGTFVPPLWLEPWANFQVVVGPDGNAIYIPSWQIDDQSGLLIHGADRLKDHLGFGYGIGGTRVRHNLPPSKFYDDSQDILLSVSEYQRRFGQSALGGVAQFSDVRDFPDGGFERKDFTIVVQGDVTRLSYTSFTVSADGTLELGAQATAEIAPDGTVSVSAVSDEDGTALLNILQDPRLQAQIDAAAKMAESSRDGGLDSLGLENIPISITNLPQLTFDLDRLDLGVTIITAPTLEFVEFDPKTGTRLPSNVRLKRLADGSFEDGLYDKRGRTLELIYDVNEDGVPLNAAGEPVLDADGKFRTDIDDTVPVVVETRITDGRGDNGKGGVTVVQSISRTTHKPVSTDIKINGNPFGIEFSDIGAALGQQLGYRIAGDSKLAGIVSSSLLKTLGDSLGDTLDGIVGNQSVGRALDDAFDTFGPELLANLKAAGIGAVSSFLTAELISAIGVDGIAGELINTGASAVVGEILTNIVNGAAPLANLNAIATIGSAVGSFIGSKLASEVISFDTIGGQIGSAVGSSLGVLGVTTLAVAGTGSSATLLGVQLGAFAGPVGALIGAFAGFIIGGLIGSVFGGTPRSGADVAWDEEEGRYVTANLYARKGGSKDAAEALASSVAGTFNAVLEATGGALADPRAVTVGNYGMRKSDFVYRPTSTRDKSAITFRVDSSDGSAFDKITGYGIYRGLTDPDFQIIGGSNYVKRAVYATVETGGMTANNFDQSVLLGNIATAQFYETYLSNSLIIGAIVAGEGDSVFAAETALNLTRAVELGLTKRHRADWFGGFNALAGEAGVSAGEIDFGFDYDPFNEKVSRLIGIGNFVLDDSIDIGGQTVITAGSADSAAQIIDLRSGGLRDQTGLTIDGKLRDDIAHSDVDFASANAVSISFAEGVSRAEYSVQTVADGLNEADEKFAVALSDASGATIVGPGAQVTIVAADALPYLNVGRAYATEADGYLVWHVGLSKNLLVGQSVSAALSLAGISAELGIDFAGTIEVSDNPDGGWNEANTLEFNDAVTDLYVRVAVVADNATIPDFEPGDAHGGSSGIGEIAEETRNVEPNETLSLGVQVVFGEAFLSNGESEHLGRGTILDASHGQTLLWSDDIFVHEGVVAKLLLARSGGSGASSVRLSTKDDRKLEIPVAATVDAGGGDDTIHASDLGDNIFGGDGDDTLYGGRLDDWLIGGAGNDRLDAGSQSGGPGGDGNYLNGGAGDDQLFGREGSDWLEGDEGVDILRAGDGGDILSGGAGEGDELNGGGGDDTYLLRRGDGADIADDLDARAPTAPTVSNPGNFPDLDLTDPIVARFAAIRSGSLKRDWLGTTAAVSAGQTAGGEDSIAFGYGITLSDVRLSRSTDGDDLIVELTEIDADGTEVLTGDKLTIRDWFSDPFKRVEWLKFVDGTEIRIGDVTSFIVGTAGDDVLIGTGGNDFVYGGAGNDKLYTLAGNDIGLGGTGDDLVSGGADDDIVVGGLGNDDLIGGSGNDAVSGDAGSDSLYGSQGDDILSGGRGDDIVVGGAGNDTFRFSRGDGNDVVFDDYSDDWTVVWQGGNWLNGYTYNASTSEVIAPDGSYVRKNFGTVEEPDLRWVGQFDYDDTTGQLRRFTPPANATTVVSDKGEDRIEFALDINVQDIMFERVTGSNDLRVVVGRDNAEAGLASARDSLTLKDWYANPGSIETFAFYAAGEIDVSGSGYNLIAGTDGIEGSAAAPLRGTAGKDWMTGAGGDDHLAGGAGDDIVAGNAGSDHLKGEAGNDVLYGGSGNDILDGGIGADVLSGGAGLDAASYASAANAVTVYLTNTALNQGDAAGDVYDSIENLIGSGAGDVLGGDDGDNEITGGKGSDFLLGGLGNDTYKWNIGDGADVIEDVEFIAETIVSAEGEIGENYEVIWTQLGAPKGSNQKTEFLLQLVHSVTGELIYDEHTFTYNGQNTQPEVRYWQKQGWQKGFMPATDGSVTRVAYDEQLDAGEADAIEMGAGISLADLFFEREGNNLRISYIVNDDGNNGDGLAVGQSNTANLLVRNHFLEKNRVEFLIFADGLSISLANVLTADSAGVVNGTDLDELIVGQRGVRDDVLTGGAGDDVLSGGEGNDTLRGGNGDDVLEGGRGADVLDGGAHSPAPAAGERSTGVRGDTARYATSGAGVMVDLASSGPQSGGDAQGDTLTGIENVTGSVYDDTLSGDDNANVLDALGGNNTLFGRGGDDVLIAGDGNDILDGGAGEDNLSGGGGNDILRGGADNDVLAGLDGDDQLFGDDGDDILSAGRGNDRLEGGLGKDQLIAGEGNDTLLGGAGEDRLVGEAGNDSLAGGADADTYFFAAGFGHDVLTDSDGANEILIDQSISYDDLWFHRSDDDLVMSVRGADDTLTIDDFFAATNAASIYSVQTATHRLFLGHPDVRNFLAEMQATGPAGAPQTIPASVAALMDRYWHEGTTARPYAEDFDVAIDEDTGTGAIAIGAIDHDENIARYEITGEALFGTASVDAQGRFAYAPDLNFNGADSFKVAIVDADGNGREIEVRVAVAPIDDAPVIDGVEGGQPLAIDERAPLSATETGSVVGRILASEFDGEAIVFTLTDDADGRFTISADGLICVADAARLDHEVNASHTVTVRVTDAVGSFDERDFAIAIRNVNEAPNVPTVLSQQDYVSEFAAAGSVIATISLTDPDATTPTLITPFDIDGLITVVGNEIRLAKDVDFETLAGIGYDFGDADGDGLADFALTIRMIASDGELTADSSGALIFRVEDVNEAPTALLTDSLAAGFAERDRVQAGTALPAITLAVLSVADPDLASQPNAQYTYVVDDARFEVVGNQLRLKQGVAFDYESEEQVTVTVTATDLGVDPLSISRELSFAVQNADDYLEGTPDADTLIGQANRDIITGLSGDDRIEGLSGDDTLTGNDGNDVILGGAGADQIDGGADDDSLHGEAGADAIWGGSGRDTISGGGDTDIIDAGEGDDIILGDDDGASDTIDGGAGIDRLDYSALGRGVSADLSAGIADGDSVTNVEEIVGSVHADMLIGDAGDNRLIGGTGADLLSGLGGSDRIEGGLDDDDISGGDGNDLLFGDEGDDRIAGDAGSDSLYGGAGADTLLGGTGDDRLEGGLGNDTLDAGDGNDTYIVDRRSNHDTIFNYDQLGTDIDVLGFNDTFGEITEHDLWFERQGDDLVVFIIGEDTSVRVTNWYLDIDPAGRANHRLDFLLGGEWVSRDTDVEGLADFQNNFTRPTTTAELEALLADPVYDATVATFYGINAPPQITGIADQRILEDGRMELVLTLADDYTPAAGIAIAGSVVSGSDLLGPQGLVVGAVGSDGTVTVTLAPAAHVAGTIGLSFTATDAGGVEATQTLQLVIDPVADTPVITQLAATPSTSGAAIALSLSVEFPDRDGSETQTIRIGDVPGGVTLNKGTFDTGSGEWVLSPTDLSGLAVLAPAGWAQDLSLSVTAFASEGGTSAQSATSTITMVINAPPTDIVSGLSVAENAEGGTAIGYLQGIDPDGDALSYELLDDADGRFTLDPDGLLKVGDGLKLDHEAAASHSILVRVTDTLGATYERLVSVGVANVNEAPTVAGDTSPAIFAEPVAAGTVLATFAGSDPDGTAPVLQLVSGTDLFVVSGNDVLLRSGAPASFADAEAYANARGISAGDFDGDGRADIKLGTIEVVASDGSLQSSVIRRDVYIENTSEAPNTPSILTNTLFSETGDGATPHAGRVVATFGLSDPDGNTPALVITGGNENGWFQVAGNSIVFAPNVDLTADYLRSIVGTRGVASGFSGDIDADGLKELLVANLSVAARDNEGLWSDTTSLAIRIEDRNEGPRFGLASYGFGLAETAVAYTQVGAVSASDIDGPASELTFGFAGGSTRFDSQLGANVGVSADGRLLVHARTGRIYTATGTAFAATGGQGFDYTLTVTDRNGDTHALSASAALRVDVDGINEAHTLSDAAGSQDEVEGLEPLTPIFDLRTLMLNDPEGRNMRWQFADGTNENGIWLLTSDGKLTLKNGGVDYEALITYYEEEWDYSNPFEPDIITVARKDPSLATMALQVQAIDDSLGLVTNATFTATINDVNEGAILTSNRQYYVVDDQGEGTFGHALTARDPDTGSTSISFAIDPASVTLNESKLSPGSSADVDNSGNPTISIVNGNRLNFQVPGDGEWEGGIKNHPTLGGRWYYQLDYGFDVVMTDPTGLKSRDRINVTFLKHGVSSAPPIVFDLDGDGIELVSLSASDVWFDMDEDGIADKTGWVSADDGLLALDRNGNGAIDDISEISFLGDIAGAQSDLEGLAAFDSNGNGRLDAGDERFFEFRIWRDLNQNGVSDEGELFSLPQAGITAVDLTSTGGESGTRGPDNFVLGTVSYERSNGTVGTAGDVFLAYEGSKEDIDDNEDVALAAPVLLDFDGDGEALVGLGQSRTSFDQDGDGERERTAWFKAGDAVLAVDRNKNGIIDDISEISFLQDVEGAKTDLEGLAAYDFDKNGVIDSNDIDFAALKLWFDRDSDGVTDAGELVSLSEAGIASISLQASEDETTGRQADGSVIYGKATFRFDDGREGTLFDTGLAYLANSATHATAIAGSPGDETEFAATSHDFERKAKKYRVYSLGGELGVTLRKASGDFDPRAGAMGALSEMQFANGKYGYLDAIVLDLDRDGIETKRYSKTNARFDMNGDGVADDTGWTSSRDGFLVVDRNGNGRVDDGSELSFYLDAPEARSAMQGLAAFDSNNDGLISALDERFGELKIWVDANHDGRSDAGEMRSLADHGIVSISIRAAASEDNQKVGRNVLLSTAVFNLADGSTGTLGDVAFGYRPSQKPAQAASTGTLRDYWIENRLPRIEELSLQDILRDDFFARFEGLRPGVEDSVEQWWRARHGDLPLELPEPAGIAPEDEATSTASPVDGDPVTAGGNNESARARMLALLMQDMAAFGPGGGIEDQLRGRHQPYALADFYS